MQQEHEPAITRAGMVVLWRHSPGHDPNRTLYTPARVLRTGAIRDLIRYRLRGDQLPAWCRLTADEWRLRWVSGGDLLLPTDDDIGALLSLETTHPPSTDIPRLDTGRASR